jgi:hypothetical protein
MNTGRWKVLFYSFCEYYEIAGKKGVNIRNKIRCNEILPQIYLVFLARFKKERNN